MVITNIHFHFRGSNEIGLLLEIIITVFKGANTAKAAEGARQSELEETMFCWVFLNEGKDQTQSKWKSIVFDVFFCLSV